MVKVIMLIIYWGSGVAVIHTDMDTCQKIKKERDGGNFNIECYVEENQND